MASSAKPSSGVSASLEQKPPDAPLAPHNVCAPNEADPNIIVATENVKTKKKAKKRPPVTVNMKDCHYRVLAVATMKCGWGRSGANPVATMFEWDVYWTDSGHGIENMVHIAKPYQRINHYPGMNCIYRKHHLAKSMNRMKRISAGEYSFFPNTWLLPDDAALVKSHLKSIPKTTQEFYIVKPASSCQGKGIYLARNWDDIKPTTSKMVVQKYLQKPLLIDGLKFDLRVYVLVVSCEPLRILVFREGLVRFCTVPYAPPTSSNMSCAYMHITNYAVNKTNINFVQNNNKKSTFVQDNVATAPSASPSVSSTATTSASTPPVSVSSTTGGSSCSSSNSNSSSSSNSNSSVSNAASGDSNDSQKAPEEESSEEAMSHKRSLSWLWQWMGENGRNSEQLWKEICDIIVKTIVAAQVNISSGVRTARPDPELRSPFGCFELLGFDILLQDDSSKPILLEVNHTPSFKTDSALDKSIKLKLIINTLKLLHLNAKEKRKYLEELSYLKTYGVPLCVPPTPADSATRPQTSRPGTSSVGSAAGAAAGQGQGAGLGSGFATGGLGAMGTRMLDKVAMKQAKSWKQYLSIEGKRRGDFDLVYPADECPNQPTYGKQALYDNLIYQLEVEREKEYVKQRLLNSSGSSSGFSSAPGFQGSIRGAHAQALAISRSLIDSFSTSSPRSNSIGDSFDAEGDLDGIAEGFGELEGVQFGDYLANLGEEINLDGLPMGKDLGSDPLASPRTESTRQTSRQQYSIQPPSVIAPSIASPRNMKRSGNNEGSSGDVYGARIMISSAMNGIGGGNLYSPITQSPAPSMGGYHGSNSSNSTSANRRPSSAGRLRSTYSPTAATLLTSPIKLQPTSMIDSVVGQPPAGSSGSSIGSNSSNNASNGRASSAKSGNRDGGGGSSKPLVGLSALLSMSKASANQGSSNSPPPTSVSPASMLYAPRPTQKTGSMSRVYAPIVHPMSPTPTPSPNPNPNPNPPPLPAYSGPVANPSAARSQSAKATNNVIGIIGDNPPNIYFDTDVVAPATSATMSISGSKPFRVPPAKNSGSSISIVNTSLLLQSANKAKYSDALDPSKHIVAWENASQASRAEKAQQQLLVNLGHGIANPVASSVSQTKASFGASSSAANRYQQQQQQQQQQQHHPYTSLPGPGPSAEAKGRTRLTSQEQQPIASASVAVSFRRSFSEPITSPGKRASSDDSDSDDDQLFNDFDKDEANGDATDDWSFSQSSPVSQE